MRAESAGDRDLLARLEQYYDTAPRANCSVETVGPFTLFVGREGWPYYARPTLGSAGPFLGEDVRRVLARQAEVEVPKAIEWVAQVTPGLVPAARAAGLQVREIPLLVLTELRVPVECPWSVVSLDSVHPALAATQAAIHLGFGQLDTERGAAGPEARDAWVRDNGEKGIAAVRRMLERDVVDMVSASGPQGVVGGGMFIARGEVAEIVGVATLPSARCEGVAAAVTAGLAARAQARGVRVVFLSAQSEQVARMYRRVGFRDVATACIAEG